MASDGVAPDPTLAADNAAAAAAASDIVAESTSGAEANVATAAADSTCLYTVTVDFEMTKTTGHDKFSN